MQGRNLVERFLETGEEGRAGDNGYGELGFQIRSLLRDSRLRKPSFADTALHLPPCFPLNLISAKLCLKICFSSLSVGFLIYLNPELPLRSLNSSKCRHVTSISALLSCCLVFFMRMTQFVTVWGIRWISFFLVMLCFLVIRFLCCGERSVAVEKDVYLTGYSGLGQVKERRMAMVLPSRTGSLGYKNVQYLETKRPWLSESSCPHLYFTLSFSSSIWENQMSSLVHTLILWGTRPAVVPPFLLLFIKFIISRVRGVLELSACTNVRGLEVLKMCGFRIAGLYGVRVRPVPPAGSTSSKPVVETSLLHRTLPDELLHEVFMRMVPYWLGRAACVCRKWRYATRAPILWRNACLKTWQACSLLSQRLQADLCGNSPLD